MSTFLLRLPSPSLSSDAFVLSCLFFDLLYKLGAGDAEVDKVLIRSQGSIAGLVLETCIKTAPFLVA
jgi:hypothetical protein